jgi:hypothetical protein
MLHQSFLARFAKLNPARLLPQRLQARPKLPPRYRFSETGHLLRSTDGGQTWREAVHLEPGYHYLRLWRAGDETRLRLEYADRVVEVSEGDV